MIKLFDDWYIDAPDLCYQLKKRRENSNKRGKPKYTIEGYYSTISGALLGLRKRLIMEQVRDGKITTIERYIGEINSQNDMFRTMLKVMELSDR